MILIWPWPRIGAARDGAKGGRRVLDVIDVWCNLCTPEASQRSYAKFPEMRDHFRWWKIEDRMEGKTVPEFIQMLDEAGVSKVLMPSFQMRSYQHGYMLHDFTPEEIVALAEQVPGRVYGLYGIDPTKKMEGVRELERSVTELGFKGAHLHAYGFGIPINDRVLYPFYAKCAELGVPVMMQVGHSAEIMPSALGRPILLDDLAIDFPEVAFVGAHTGWPWVEELIALAWKHPHVYIATTMHKPRYWDEKLIQFINTRGQDKVMWGSDYPGLAQKDCLDDIEVMALREHVRPKLLWENAARVFKI
jgi:predicted TIM-barrel fold metal-dependent hydrolase